MTRHAGARREHQAVTWSRVRGMAPPPVELLFLAVVVVPLVGTYCVVSGALGLLAALWAVTVT